MSASSTTDVGDSGETAQTTGIAKRRLALEKRRREHAALRIQRIYREYNRSHVWKANMRALLPPILEKVTLHTDSRNFKATCLRLHWDRHPMSRPLHKFRLQMWKENLQIWLDLVVDRVRFGPEDLKNTAIVRNLQPGTQYHFRLRAFDHPLETESWVETTFQTDRLLAANTVRRAHPEGKHKDMFRPDIVAIRKRRRAVEETKQAERIKRGDYTATNTQSESSERVAPASSPMPTSPPSPSNGDKTARIKRSKRRPVVVDTPWESHVSASGYIYYWNRETNESSWSPPIAVGPRTNSVPSTEQLGKNIGGGWMEYRDEQSGHTYFHHALTGKTQWYSPFADSVETLTTEKRATKKAARPQSAAPPVAWSKANPLRAEVLRDQAAAANRASPGESPSRKQAELQAARELAESYAQHHREHNPSDEPKATNEANDDSRASNNEQSATNNGQGTETEIESPSSLNHPDTDTSNGNDSASKPEPKADEETGSDASIKDQQQNSKDDSGPHDTSDQDHDKHKTQSHSIEENDMSTANYKQDSNPAWVSQSVTRKPDNSKSQDNKKKTRKPSKKTSKRKLKKKNSSRAPPVDQRHPLAATLAGIKMPHGWEERFDPRGVRYFYNRDSAETQRHLPVDPPRTRKNKWVRDAHEKREILAKSLGVDPSARGKWAQDMLDSDIDWKGRRNYLADSKRASVAKSAAWRRNHPKFAKKKRRSRKNGLQKSRSTALEAPFGVSRRRDLEGESHVITSSSFNQNPSQDGDRYPLTGGAAQDSHRSPNQEKLSPRRLQYSYQDVEALLEVQREAMASVLLEEKERSRRRRSRGKAPQVQNHQPEDSTQRHDNSSDSDSVESQVSVGRTRQFLRKVANDSLRRVGQAKAQLFEQLLESRAKNVSKGASRPGGRPRRKKLVWHSKSHSRSSSRASSDDPARPRTSQGRSSHTSTNIAPSRRRRPQTTSRM